MTRPCNKDHWISAGRRAGCPHCLAATKPTPGPAKAAQAPCVHLGSDTGDLVECGGCAKGRTQLKVFACAVHERCVTTKTSPGIAACVGCVDRATKPPRRFPIRDCLYHVYPAVRGADKWRACVKMLARRSALFTGAKICAVMTGLDLEPVSEVAKLLPDFEIISFPNNPDLREVVSLPAMLEMVETRDPERALFWGHAKGVTRPTGSSFHPWSWLLHEACLDYWPVVEHQLSEFPVTGAFKKLGMCFAGSPSNWHYSGSFFWARSADLFGRDWQEIDQIQAGIESYPSLHFAREEAGNLFGEGNFSLADMPTFQAKAVEFMRWKAANDHRRTKA